MPIATPDIYAAMLDRAKAGAFAYPAINCTSSQTVVAAIRGFAEAESDGIVQFSWGGAEFASGQTVKDMVTGAVALAEFAHVVADEVRRHHRAAHRPLPEGQARRLHAPAHRRERRARRRPGVTPLFQSHMWDGSAVELQREPGHRRRAARQVRRREDHPGDRDRRRRWRGGRRRGHARRQALLDARGRPRDRREARARRARALHGRRDVRQRARRLQAGQRRADPVDPQGHPERGRARSTARTSPSTWSSTAARARCCRRSARPSTTASSR